MDRQIRFGSYIREITVRQKLISYNDLVPEIQQDENGADVPYHPPKLDLRNIDIYRLVQPYVSIRLYDQIKAVLPLALYLVLFQLFILRQDLTDSWVITAGLSWWLASLPPGGQYF